jgi:hypothetical protein
MGLVFVLVVQSFGGSLVGEGGVATYALRVFFVFF